MKKYTVYLFRSPHCIRGWLAYIKPHDRNAATVTVDIYAETGARAKNKAVTAANNSFSGVSIVHVNRQHKLWGVNNFPELADILAK